MGTKRATSRPPTSATGAIAKKMLDHEKRPSSQPPKIGPSAIATPAVAPHRPIARARSLRSVKTLLINDSVAGNTSAAPSPIAQRAAISSPELEAKPPTRLAEPNSARPASRVPLRPTRSDRLPAASRNEANTRL